MKRLFIKKVSLLLAGLLLASQVPFSAFADTIAEESQHDTEDKAFSLWADGNPNLDSENQHSIDVIRWISSNDLYKDITNGGDTKSNQYYLLMPASADLSSLTLWHNFSEDPTINGVPVKNGEVTNAVAGTGEYSMTAEGREITLTVMQSQNIGSIYINTESGNMKSVHADKEHKEPGDILVVEPDGTADYNGELAHIKGRGNTTWKFISKKPYNIKLDKKASLLGMDASKKWCLLANGQDHTQIRNKIAFDLADEVGLEYSPDSQFTDLYLNGEYVGVYQLTEKVEAGKNNLVKIKDLASETEKANEQDLDKYTQVLPETKPDSKKYFEIPNNPEDITGGYLLEFDVDNKYDTEASGFVTNRGQCVVVKSPEYATKEQVDYISSFVQDLEDAIYSHTGKNDKGIYFTEYIDLESAALMYLVQEYSLNIDCGVTSFFLYKDSDTNGDGKIHTAPPWDFDVAFGNLETYLDDTHTFKSPDALYAATEFDWKTNENLLFAQLYTYKEFQELVKKLYNEKFKPALNILNSSEAVSGEHIKSIAAYREILEPSVNMNFVRWDIREKRLVPKAGLTYDSQMNYLWDFTSKRSEFFEEHFNNTNVGDEFVVFFNREIDYENTWDKVYLYYTNGNNTVEWPGIEMTPLKYKGWDNICKLDLGALGEKDDGSIRVIVNDGGENRTRCVEVHNNQQIRQESVYFESDGIERFVTFMYPFDEKNIKDRSYPIGDVDGDGKITAADSLKILRFSVGLDYPKSWEEHINSYIDSDNRITSADALYVLRCSVGLKNDNILNPDGYEVGALFERYLYEPQEP